MHPQDAGQQRRSQLSRRNTQEVLCFRILIKLLQSIFMQRRPRIPRMLLITSTIQEPHTQS